MSVMRCAICETPVDTDTNVEWSCELCGDTFCSDVCDDAHSQEFIHIIDEEKR